MRPCPGDEGGNTGNSAVAEFEGFVRSTLLPRFSFSMEAVVADIAAMAEAAAALASSAKTRCGVLMTDGVSVETRSFSPLGVTCDALLEGPSLWPDDTGLA